MRIYAKKPKDWLKDWDFVIFSWKDKIFLYNVNYINKKILTNKKKGKTMRNEKFQSELSNKYGATFPGTNKMKIVLPKGSSIEDNCHTVTIHELIDGRMKVQSKTLNGVKKPRLFEPDELIEFFDNYCN